MNKTILLLVNTISIKTGGGTASAKELMKTLKLNGFNVHICIIGFNANMYFDNKAFIKFDNIQKDAIHYLPGFIRNRSLSKKTNIILSTLFSHFIKGVFTLSKTDIKRVIEILFYLVNSKKESSFYSLLNEADIIIEAAGLNADEICFLKDNFKASVVLNHAGSREAYEKYWLTPKFLPKNSNPSLSVYTNFCLSYDKILFQAEENANECASLHPKLKESVITILPTCNEAKIIKATSLTNPYCKGKFIIVNVGSVQPRKAQHRSIEAFASIADRYPQSELHFVGGSVGFRKYQSQLKKQVKKLVLEKRIYFHGYRSDYLRFMKYADILLQSSEAEGVSRVLREAMFMKLPIVSFSISGTRDILENMKEALLAPEKDVKSLGRMLGSLIENPDLSKQIANDAFEKYYEKHSNLVYNVKVKTEFQKINKAPHSKLRGILQEKAL